jgi:hypothetical protein
VRFGAGPPAQGKALVSSSVHGAGVSSIIESTRIDGCPFAGEVGWILDGQTFIAWRGEVLSWHTA